MGILAYRDPLNRLTWRDAGKTRARIEMGPSFIHRPLSRRRLLGQAGMAGLALAAAPARAQSMVDLALPVGPSE